MAEVDPYATSYAQKRIKQERIKKPGHRSDIFRGSKPRDLTQIPTPKEPRKENGVTVRVQEA